MTTIKGLTSSFEFPVSSYVLMQKAPRQALWSPTFRQDWQKGWGTMEPGRRARFSYDDLLGLFTCGSPLADGTGQALLSRRRERVNNDPRAQPNVCVGGLSVT